MQALGDVAQTLPSVPSAQCVRAAAMTMGAAPAVQLTAPNRTGLPDDLKSGVAALSGFSMDDVRVHRNSSRPAALQAHAYAQGSDIYLAPGQERHLAHEAWHVVQQKQGRVAATRQLKPGTPINDDVALEREADKMGARADAPRRSNISVSGSRSEEEHAWRTSSAVCLRSSLSMSPGRVQRVPVLQRRSDGALRALGRLNPRRYLPEWAMGYSEDEMNERQNRALAGGPLNILGRLNPRRYLPSKLYGYSEAQMQEHHNVLRGGPFNALGRLNPRRFLPRYAGGYSKEQMEQAHNSLENWQPPLPKGGHPEEPKSFDLPVQHGGAFTSTPSTTRKLKV